MIRSIAHKIAERLQPEDPLRFVKRYTLEVRDLRALQAAMGWRHDPILDAPHLRRFDAIEDLNERRLRDAEVIYTACRNSDAETMLEIGTAYGETTAEMARHAPRATLHTVNIPPEEIGEGGKAVTYALSREDIGRAYRAAGCTNVRQILANTANWEPDFGPIDLAFIDGCHDADFVYSDTRKVLAKARPGTIILWHDYNPDLAGKFDWIGEVCRGVERLYRERLLVDRTLHLRDSWVGLYRVPGAADEGRAAA